MPSLTQTLAHHGRILVLDAASTRVQVGLLVRGLPARWHASPEEAGRSLFTSTSTLLAQAGLSLDDIDAFIYAEGPGSMLGTRTVAMTLRTWTTLRPRPVFAYRSLALVARHVWRQQPRACGLIADARRGAWHVQGIDAAGRLSALQRLPATDLPPGELLTPENFRAWAEPPRPAATCSYDLLPLFASTADDDLLHASAEPDAFQPTAPDYKKWSAQPHSAETATPR